VDIYWWNVFWTLNSVRPNKRFDTDSHGV